MAKRAAQKIRDVGGMGQAQRSRRPKGNRAQRRRVQKLRAAIRVVEKARTSGDPALFELAYGKAPNPVPVPTPAPEPARTAVGEVSVDTRPLEPSVFVTVEAGAVVNISR